LPVISAKAWWSISPHSPAVCRNVDMCKPVF
jgi:hypothetical protein